ncbi:MAG: hypothetical protein JWM80_2959 [Cyanobacteria bacterium RYN_339]|nr:hypothetical protein [Cyanobacteria bacterium RYN_339]
MRPLLIAALVLSFATPAFAQEEEEEAPAPAPTAMDTGKLDQIQKGLAGQHDSDGQLGKLMRIVKALKNGGKDLTAEDIDMLQAVLGNMAAKNENPELSGALQMLGPQLEALKRQKANPQGDDDDLKSLLDQ